jgi:hypothetical protein
VPFADNNLVSGLAKNDQFQIGRDDTDTNVIIEKDALIPWSTDPAGSYMYFECVVGTVLDSGIVVHNVLPQVDNEPDTLSVIALDDPSLDEYTGPGLNITCKDQYRDILQRMGHSRYWFRIWGQALRVGYQVPIPGIKKVGGTDAIPYDKNPQWGYNAIAPGGNYSGVILWRAVWSLWYTTITQPTTNVIPAADPSAHINGTTPLPNGMQSPFSQADDDASKKVFIINPKFQ